jgi:hypothetical protein
MVYPRGQVSVQVKLNSTMPEIHPVQLLIVDPKQKVQLPSQEEQAFPTSFGYFAGGQTIRQLPLLR